MRDQIYDLLRSQIVTGAISPASIIDEKSIAAQLSVSRTPVREAVKKLSDENLVEVFAQSRTRAAPLDLKELHQAYIVRRALEIESTALAVSNMTKTHLSALSELLLQHAQLIAAKDYVNAIAADDNFHRYIAEISGLPRLWRAVEISKAHLDRCRHLALPHPGEAEATLSQHRKIIRSLQSKDAEKARSAMAEHLDRAYSNAMDILEQQLSAKRTGE